MSLSVPHLPLHSSLPIYHTCLSLQVRDLLGGCNADNLSIKQDTARGIYIEGENRDSWITAERRTSSSARSHKVCKAIISDSCTSLCHQRRLRYSLKPSLLCTIMQSRVHLAQLLCTTLTFNELLIQHTSALPLALDLALNVLQPRLWIKP